MILMRIMLRLRLPDSEGGGKRRGRNIYVNVRHFDQILKHKYSKTVFAVILFFIFCVCLFLLFVIFVCLLFSKHIKDDIYCISEFEMTI